jgi:hypothetical protein
VRCGDDELVRTAMLMPDWPDVGKRARAELAALYADEGLSDRQFATRLAGVIAADDVLADLVAVAELRSGGGEQPRDVLDVQGGGAPPYVWRCDEPDCTTAVPGTYSRAATGPNCSAHPALVLRRTP